jgi:hypothetical protein
MKQSTAKLLHEATNITYWLGNPDWDAGSPVRHMALVPVRRVIRGVHAVQKTIFFDTSQLIAVSGESVVVANGHDKVDKFMFRYPDDVTLDVFRENVASEVGAVTSMLAGIALPTDVSIKPARIFRNHSTAVDAVVQTQPRLDTEVYVPLDVGALCEEWRSPSLDRTAKDLEWIVTANEELERSFSWTPDLAQSSGNVRRSSVDGAVRLIDVMPLYTYGGRLIGDSPPGILAASRASIVSYEVFVGRYGG